MWKVMGAPHATDIFDTRIKLMEGWWGLEGEKLQQESEITDAEFVHHKGFVGGAWSMKSAIKMAVLSAEVKKEKTKLR